jgi:hypothetical protein
MINRDEKKLLLDIIECINSIFESNSKKIMKK